MNEYMVSVILKTPGPTRRKFESDQLVLTESTVRSDFTIKESDSLEFMSKVQKEILDSKFIIFQDATEGIHMFDTDQIAAIHINKI